jgi:two-component system NtrC family sensor kinase
VTIRVATSLKLTVPLILLGFAAALSTVNLLYHVPRAEHIAEEENRRHLAQEMSRLQSTLEYLLLKGDLQVAQHEIAVLAHNHDYRLVALTDDKDVIFAATRRAWLGRQITEVLPDFESTQAYQAARERRGRITLDADDSALLGYAGILMASQQNELRPSRTGSLFISYDLTRSKAEARAQVMQQSLYWAGWVTALALAMWLVFHFLLTRRTARLVRAAEQLAAGNLEARSALRGSDELGRLSRAFDSMAADIERDFAARIKVQQALLASQEQYRTMFNASIDGLALWSRDGAIVDINPALWKMYGYSDEEFLARDPEKPIRQEPRPALDRIMPSVSTGKAFHTELTDRRKDGSLLELEVHGIPMEYRAQPHMLTISRDITDKKRASEELARQRETSYQREKLAALGSLLAGVAHELNNPLSVVVARAVILEEQGDEATHAAAVKIRTAAERCARIVRTFLAMARQQQPEHGSVAINDVVSAALDIAGYAVRTGGIEVVLDLQREIPYILADADQLHQVLLNLIINAQQALLEQPLPRRIYLSSRHDAAAGVIRIAVADNGPGIPEAHRARVFEPYFTTKPSGIGTGVGLAVSFGIVAAHGGTLTVDCPAEGGAVFTITLPAGKVDARVFDAPPAKETTARARSILIVDDEADIRETLAEILTSVQHRVVAVSSGREALERMAAAHYDVILADIRMPDFDGRALYQEIVRRWPTRAECVVFVTGDTLATSLREFAAENRRPVIEKPFLPSDVRRIVAEMTNCQQAAR